MDLTMTDSDGYAEHIDGGGIVCHVDVSEAPIKWAGMITTHETPPQIRFIPAYILHLAILRYKQSTRSRLDPVAIIGETEKMDLPRK